MPETGFYLFNHPPKRAKGQYRRRRREPVSGVIVIHTAENMIDLAGADTGAEGVARFIANRTDAPGSYHTIVDSDSRVRLIPFDAEAYHDGTGTNIHSIGISFACKAADWPRMTDARRAAFIDQGAQAAAEAIEHCQRVRGRKVPLGSKIKVSDARARRPGFLGHGDLDPKRRSDPGRSFPWSAFLKRTEHYVDGFGVISPLPSSPPPGGNVSTVQVPKANIIKVQQNLVDGGYDLGSYGPRRDGVDGQPGRMFWAALDAAIADAGDEPDDPDGDKWRRLVADLKAGL